MVHKPSSLTVAKDMTSGSKGRRVRFEVLNLHTGEKLRYRVKPATNIGKLKKTFGDHLGVDEQRLDFVFDGRSVEDQETPESLHVEPSEEHIYTIEARIEGYETTRTESHATTGLSDENRCATESPSSTACPVCQESFAVAVPKMLTACGHSMCENCIVLSSRTVIGSTEKRIRCVTCGKLTTIPDDGLPVNLGLRNVAQSLCNQIQNSAQQFQLKLNTELGLLHERTESVLREHRLLRGEIEDSVKTLFDFQTDCQLSREALDRENITPEVYASYLSEIEGKQISVQNLGQVIGKFGREFKEAVDLVVKEPLTLVSAVAAGSSDLSKLSPPFSHPSDSVSPQQFDSETGCYTCGRVGHFSRECPSGRGGCFDCGEQGHFYRDCHKFSSQSSAVPNDPSYVCKSCGLKGDHFSRSCPVIKCFACDKVGHEARLCPGRYGDSVDDAETATERKLMLRNTSPVKDDPFRSNGGHIVPIDAVPNDPNYRCRLCGAVQAHFARHCPKKNFH